MTFLALRMACATLLLGLLAWLTRAPWPANPAAGLHLAVGGLLVHAGYLGGVFAAMALGMPAGMVSLIVGMQPVLTAIFAGAFLHEQLRGRQVAGLALGVAGLALVLGGRVSVAALGWGSGGCALLALCSISLGTVYQKKFNAGADLRTTGVMQYGASAIVFALAAVLLRERATQWTQPFCLALGWSIFGLSFGAVALLYRLIREGAATRVSSLLYLVPPVTAVIAYACFGEQLTRPALAGMALVAGAVALVVVE